MNYKKISLKVLDNRLKTDYQLPKYETNGSAGLDLRAMINESLVLKAGQTILVPSGFAIDIADNKICAVIVPRSGLGHKHGIILGNSIGIIDADYQGEIKISLWNRTDNDFTIDVGMRVAQLIFLPIERVNFDTVDEFKASNRGDGGFGSTGV